MYYLPVIFSFLFVLLLILKFSSSSPLKEIKKIQNKLPTFPTRNGRGGGAYLDMDDEEEQGHALDKLDFLSTGGGGGSGNDKKKNIQEDPFQFGLRGGVGGESKSYTPLFSPEKKRNSLMTTSTSPVRSTPPSAPTDSSSSSRDAEFADFADFVTVGFDS
jgi:hypothetical protein